MANSEKGSGRELLWALALIIVTCIALVTIARSQTPTPPEVSPESYGRAHRWLAAHATTTDNTLPLAALLDSVATEASTEEHAQCLKDVTECLRGN